MDLTQILIRKYPQTEWTLNGDFYDGLTWLSDSEKPSEQQLVSLWPEVADEIAKEELEKTRKRQALLDKLGITEEEAKLLLS